MCRERRGQGAGAGREEPRAGARDGGRHDRLVQSGQQLLAVQRLVGQDPVQPGEPVQRLGRYRHRPAGQPAKVVYDAVGCPP